MSVQTPTANCSAAEAFRREHAAYFFEDAHFLVEAEAARVAREVAPNVFEFADGSKLVIDTRGHSVRAESPTPRNS